MKNTLSLILLVGGKSSRMGQDKSALKLSLFSQTNIANKKNQFYVPNEKSIEYIKGTKDINFSQENQNQMNDMDFFEHALSLLLSLSMANSHIKTSIKISCLESQHEFMQKRLSNLGDVLDTEGVGTNVSQPKQNVEDFEFIFDNGVGVCEAIHRCLEKTQTACLFIPCDTPFLTTDILQQLINAWQSASLEISHEISDTCHHVHDTPNSSCQTSYNEPYNNEQYETGEQYASYVFADTNTHKKQSLIAIYTQKALPYLISGIETKMPLQKSIPEEFTKVLYYNKEQEPFFQNLNTIKDLNQAKYIDPH